MTTAAARRCAAPPWPMPARPLQPGLQPVERPRAHLPAHRAHRLNSTSNHFAGRVAAASRPYPDPGEEALKPTVYSPVLGPLYRDILAHCRVVTLPYRLNIARGKQCVVWHATNAPPGFRFESFGQALSGSRQIKRADADWSRHSLQQRVAGLGRRSSKCGAIK